MNPNKEKLIGTLIGIARSTDGNEHLISDESTAFLRECLAAEIENSEEFRFLMERAAHIKRAMVPNCFFCANPCGRTAAFDFRELDGLEPGIRETKLRLLDHLAALSRSGRGPDRLLYQGLIVIGMEDYPQEDLTSILLETEKALY